MRADGSIVFANAKQPKKEPPPDYSARADVPYTPDLNPPRQVAPAKAPAGGEQAVVKEDPLPESVQIGTLDAITLIAYDSGYRMDDEQRVNAIRRLTMKWREKFDKVPKSMLDNFVEVSLMIVEELRRIQDAELHQSVDENDA